MIVQLSIAGTHHHLLTTAWVEMDLLDSRPHGSASEPLVVLMDDEEVLLVFGCYLKVSDIECQQVCSVATKLFLSMSSIVCGVTNKGMAS